MPAIDFIYKAWSLGLGTLYLINQDLPIANINLIKIFLIEVLLFLTDFVLNVLIIIWINYKTVPP